MNRIESRQIAVIVSLGILGWALCGAIMFIGMAFMELQTTLIIHMISAPIIFGLISWFYFKGLHYTSPKNIGFLFLLIVVCLDFFLVGLIIDRSLDMFRSPLGTWIPFVLIYLSTYLTGVAVEKRE